MQFYIETDENTRRVELNLSNFDGENADLGWVVYVRQGMPVGHEVKSLGETGLSLAYAKDFDWMVDGNDASVQIEVDSQTYQVRADGQLLECEPAKELPMAQRYFLF